MTVFLNDHDHEPAVGDPLPGSPAASPFRQAAETTTAPVFVDSSGLRVPVRDPAAGGPRTRWPPGAIVHRCTRRSGTPGGPSEGSGSR
ncbi:hypothetical protein GCM10009639_62770 [Kitasatospora putterlickiae]|uniref:Uncharacterized protein n=1 Tax=Kitasatospora putterlickiae TaxID=221725 RepID=A0ABN1YKY5_9ACTN